MSASVGGQNLIVEVFDAETETRHADRFERFEFRFLQGTRLALERDLFRFVPTHVTIETVDEITQLLVADVRRRAAAEVSKAKLASFERRHATVKLVLFDQCVEIDLDLGSVLVGIDFEVTKVTAFTAERNVNIKA
jgi:hypothetical protein